MTAAALGLAAVLLLFARRLTETVTDSTAASAVLVLETCRSSRGCSSTSARIGRSGRYAA
jgi:hypothetical protein